MKNFLRARVAVGALICVLRAALSPAFADNYAPPQSTYTLPAATTSTLGGVKSPTTTTSGDVLTFNGTGGAIQDSGTLLSSLVTTSALHTALPATSGLYGGTGSAGGAAAITVGSGLTLSGGTLTATGGSSTLTVGSTATSGGAAGQLMFDTGSVLTESGNLLYASNTLTVGQSTTAQGFAVYNTSSSSNANYERGVLDWTSNSNVLTIGTENAGTGSARNLEFVVGGSNTMDYGVTHSGSWNMGISDGYVLYFGNDDGGIYINNYAFDGNSRAEIGFNSWISTPNGVTFGATIQGHTPEALLSYASAGVLTLDTTTAGNAAGQLELATLTTKPTTVSALPSASTSGAGSHAYVSDATTCATINASLTGGGSTGCSVHSNGTNWLVGG